MLDGCLSLLIQFNPVPFNMFKICFFIPGDVFRMHSELNLVFHFYCDVHFVLQIFENGYKSSFWQRCILCEPFTTVPVYELIDCSNRKKGRIWDIYCFRSHDADVINITHAVYLLQKLNTESLYRDFNDICF